MRTTHECNTPGCICHGDKRARYERKKRFHAINYSLQSDTADALAYGMAYHKWVEQLYSPHMALANRIDEEIMKSYIPSYEALGKITTKGNTMNSPEDFTQHLEATLRGLNGIAQEIVIFRDKQVKELKDAVEKLKVANDSLSRDNAYWRRDADTYKNQCYILTREYNELQDNFLEYQNDVMFHQED